MRDPDPQGKRVVPGAGPDERLGRSDRDAPQRFAPVTADARGRLRPGPEELQREGALIGRDHEGRARARLVAWAREPRVEPERSHDVRRGIAGPEGADRAPSPLTVDGVEPQHV